MYILNAASAPMPSADNLLRYRPSLLFYGMLFPLVIANFIRSIWLVYKQARTANILCLLQTFFFLVNNLYTLQHYLEPVADDCTETILVQRGTFVLSMMCIHAILLIKAYICSNGTRYLLAMAAFTESLFFLYYLISMAQSVEIESTWGDCDVTPTISSMLLRVGVGILPNAFLSLYFLCYAYRHCHNNKQGASTLSNLFLDGIFYLIGVTLTDILVCLVIVIGLTLGRTWTVLFSLDLKDIRTMFPITPSSSGSTKNSEDNWRHHALLSLNYSMCQSNPSINTSHCSHPSKIRWWSSSSDISSAGRLINNTSSFSVNDQSTYLSVPSLLSSDIDNSAISTKNSMDDSTLRSLFNNECNSLAASTDALELTPSPSSSTSASASSTSPASTLSGLSSQSIATASSFLREKFELCRRPRLGRLVRKLSFIPRTRLAHRTVPSRKSVMSTTRFYDPLRWPDPPAGACSFPVDPQELRFSLKHIPDSFADGPRLDSLVYAVRRGLLSIEAFVPLRVRRGPNGKLYAIDCRRLYVLRKAGVTLATAMEIPHPMTEDEIARSGEDALFPDTSSFVHSMEQAKEDIFRLIDDITLFLTIDKRA
ncbi:hypothetical protein BDF22DRAFT_741906 [Syncephalis plumigaleata]|nr:hypothetical protein BDF22DRAFT_741906 [Syncephalis plumigaleata]